MKIYNNVSLTQLSIAKFSGAIKINGETFIYDYANDALVLDKNLKEYKKLELPKKPKFQR